MKPSQNALQLIINREGVKLTSYLIKGEKYYTIGVGHHCDGTHPWDKQLNRPGAKITMAQANELLLWNLKDKASVIDAVVKVPMTQNMYDALISTLYQYNPSNSSIKALIRAINLGYNATQFASILLSLPSNNYNKKARKADGILATLGKVVHLETLKV